ncbi:MAG TPA: hypothetical protein VLV30_02265 [Methanomicrobiales archaeon]|nr:hypothetical protein [Methanomicrobiales archaeon]
MSPGDGNRSSDGRKNLGGFGCGILFTAMLLGLLVIPAGAVLTLNPMPAIYNVGDTVTVSGLNTENTTTFLFITGPYVDMNGAMLTNTSRLAINGYFDTAAVSKNFSWSFDWNTSLPGVNLNAGIYVVYASVAPVNRGALAGRTYDSQMVSFHGTALPTPAATAATPTPVPTWAPPPAGTEVQVSSGPTDDYPGRFDGGDLIPYEAMHGDGNVDLYLYNISSGKTTTVATGPGVRSSPSLSGGTLVYSAYQVHQQTRTDSDVYVYNVASGTTKELTLPGDQLNPRISGDIVAWQDEPPGHSSVNVVLHDLGTNVSLKVPAHAWAYSPDISGGMVIWIDDLTAPEVWSYDIATNEVRRVTNRTGITSTPTIDGTRITWADTRTDFAEIYVQDLVTGAETQVTTADRNYFTPAISGDRVAWVDFRNGNRDIYLYDLATQEETPVTTALGEQVSPQIGGCTVTWADNRNGSFDVYYEQIPGCTPAPGPAPVSLQPQATATPVQETTAPTAAVVTTTQPITTASTTTVPPPTVVPTTKSPGFEALPAFAMLAAAVLVLGRRRNP